MYEYALLLVFPAVMAFAGAMDLLTMTIPNRISIALTVAFVLAAPLLGMPLSMFGMHIAAGLIVLAAGIILFAVGGFGGGDAKLLAAGALWIGLDGLVAYLVAVTLAGGALSLAVIAYRRLPLLIFRIPGWATRLHRPRAAIPYGIAIAAGAMYVYPKSPWFSQLLG